MVAKYGYQVALTKSGLITRSQFFNPTRFLDEFPTLSQMVLMGEKPIVYDQNDLSIWENPFSFNIEDGRCFVFTRGLVVVLPLSRNPLIPLAEVLPFAPSRYKMKPDFRTIFE